MKVNFHNLTGAMVQGLDGHTYYTIAAPAPPPVPLPMIGHAVVGLFVAENRIWRIASKVWVGLTPGLQSNWARLLVPHIPFPTPPHPAAEPASLAIIVLTSSSSPVMTVHSVKGQGQALTCCLAACVGVNQNCGSPLGGSATLNVVSVKTKPTPGDYVAAVVGIAINTAFNYLSGKIPGIPGAIAVAVAQNLADLAESYDVPPWWLAPIMPAVAAAQAVSKGTSWAQEQAQKAVDGK